MNAHRIIIPRLQLAETKDKEKRVWGKGISSSLKPCKTLFINPSANLTKCTRVLKPQKKKERI
jgi:hypothetical protein